MDRAILLGNTLLAHYLQKKTIRHHGLLRFADREAKTKFQNGRTGSFKCVRFLGVKRYSVSEVCIMDRRAPQECGADLKKIVTRTSLSGKLLSL